MKLIITLCCVFSFCTLISQTKIKGSVFDKEAPLVGTNIIIKHSDKGTISDFDGNFEINAKASDTLIISYLGYDSKEIAVGNKKEMNVVLKGSIALDQVKIVAYGSYKCETICCEIGVIQTGYCKVFKSDLLTEKLYPNPSKTGRFQLHLIEDYKNVQLQVFNMSGQLIMTIKAKPMHKSLNLDLSHFSSGMYIVGIYVNGQQIGVKKAIID
ncbi:T9SS type A sorting domain-containing protein [Hyunsoonleella flava]|uniref:T9SS type A sorting domain-containing protein n=1 Tax=Hyunsoonleella flava TaxID=2527939 RepID=A0A4V2JA43_9FLAO|nr:carboxypeptidase-like regulatory domain-containing protein [Hyunsoonleella flava]TBN02673.1 T9SS type A sorting domain-containing protein [Hyunsoonleella flava]